MTSEEEKGARPVWLIWMLALMAGMFVFWYVRSHREV